MGRVNDATDAHVVQLPIINVQNISLYTC